MLLRFLQTYVEGQVTIMELVRKSFFDGNCKYLLHIICVSWNKCFKFSLQTYDEGQVTIMEGQFPSPLEKHLPHVLPERSKMAYFKAVLPRRYLSGDYRPVCIHLAGTGDHVSQHSFVIKLIQFLLFSDSVLFIMKFYLVLNFFFL